MNPGRRSFRVFANLLLSTGLAINNQQEAGWSSTACHYSSHLRLSHPSAGKREARTQGPCPACAISTSEPFPEAATESHALSLDARYRVQHAVKYTWQQPSLHQVQSRATPGWLRPAVGASASSQCSWHCWSQVLNLLSLRA